MSEKIQSISPLVDQFSRTISYLRLSVTDHCNLRCMYCMPEHDGAGKPIKHGNFLHHDELLTYEELLRVVRIAVGMGMNKLRLTGGEPLVRRGILDFIKELSKIDGLNQVLVTTNGVLLGEYAEDLLASGVHQVNVSLDTMHREKFKQISGRDYFDKVWESLLTVERLGFKVKLNAVAMKGINDDEFLDFARLSLEHSFQIRFIEFMPAGDAGSWSQGRFCDSDEIIEKIRTIGSLEPSEKQRSSGPAKLYTFSSGGRKGTLGFISPISHHFCDQCTRLRLTSEGRLRPCLLHDIETDLRVLLRGGVSDDVVRNAIRDAIFNKPKGHQLNTVQDVVEKSHCSGGMSKIGG